jgi:hypothetical protein
METAWGDALWQQLGAAIAALENPLATCPDSLWTERLWPGAPPPDFPPQFADFWYVGFHALVWLDLYLAGVPEEEFAPHAPFAQGVLDSAESAPEQPYTKEMLLGYLASLREKCRTTLAALTDEQARRTVEYPWTEGRAVSYLELQLYNMRHVQEHAAHLSMYLGQHGISGEQVDWVPRAQEESASQ